MGILDSLLRRKKKKEELLETPVENRPTSELEEICKDALEVYEALENTMFLNPTKIKISIKDAVAKAKELEKAKDKLRAATWYKIAGGLAIYEGDVSKVQEYFGKYAKLTGQQLKILEIPEKAVEKAQEYYKKYLKVEKEVT